MAVKIVLLLAIVAYVHAGVVPVHTGGTSISTRQQDGHGNYAFQYQINDGASTHGRAEAGNPHGVVGSYNLGIIDGRQRKVSYVADGAGFRAKVQTNEQGTALSAPAAAIIESPYTGTVAGNTVAVAHAAAPVAAIAAAPLAVAHAAPLAVAHAAPVAAYGAGYGVAAAPYGAAIAAPYGAGIAAPYGAAIAAPYGAGIAAPYGAAIAAPYGAAYGAPYGAGLGAYGVGYGKTILG